jgi:hypothetical protein
MGNAPAHHHDLANPELKRVAIDNDSRPVGW